MGVEFGPWVREFSTQIRRSWFIPYEAAQTSGHVVVVVRVGRDGRIESPSIKEPSPVAAFNDSAVNAIAGVKSAAPLPAGYPSDHADLTITFYFSESRPQLESRPPGDGPARLIGRDVPLSTPTTPPVVRGTSRRGAKGHHRAPPGWVQFWVQ
jgi:TonB family protein